MIFRSYLYCPGCEAKLILRLGVGIDEIQPFYFVCDGCGAPTKGVLKVNYDTAPTNTELKLEGTELTDETFDQPDQMITISLDLPCVTTAQNELAEWPFLHQMELMNEPDGLLKYQHRIGSFRNMVKDWPNVRRIMTYYVERNWQQFDEEWRRVFEDTWQVPTSEFSRHDGFHRVLEMLFVALLPRWDYPLLKAELNFAIANLVHQHSDITHTFVNSLYESDYLKDYQRSLLERLSFAVENFSALAPGFPIFFLRRSCNRKYTFAQDHER